MNLPRGLRIDHGYVQVRLRHKGTMYCKNFGRACPDSLELGRIHLSKKREEIRLGKFGYAPTLPSKTFTDVASLFIDRWSKQTDAEGNSKHTDKAVRNVRSFIETSLIPFFGKMEYDRIRPVDVQTWRDKRVQSVLGTSVNREQGVLSSIFSHVETWVKSSQIKPFKIPAENPTTHIEFAETRKRERVLSLLELARLKDACDNDLGIWEICKMALKSLLRRKDLMRLEAGQDIDIIQAKTGIRLELPVGTKALNYVNFRKRWEAVRKAAMLEDCQFRDLRKTGATLLKGKNYSNKIISEALGHTTTRTTEIYMVKDQEHLKAPLQDLSSIVDGI